MPGRQLRIQHRRGLVEDRLRFVQRPGVQQHHEHADPAERVLQRRRGPQPRVRQHPPRGLQRRRMLAQLAARTRQIRPRDAAQPAIGRVGIGQRIQRGLRAGRGLRVVAQVVLRAAAVDVDRREHRDLVGTQSRLGGARAIEMRQCLAVAAEVGQHRPEVVVDGGGDHAAFAEQLLGAIARALRIGQCGLRLAFDLAPARQRQPGFDPQRRCRLQTGFGQRQQRLAALRALRRRFAAFAGGVEPRDRQFDREAALRRCGGGQRLRLAQRTLGLGEIAPFDRRLGLQQQRGRQRLRILAPLSFAQRAHPRERGFGVRVAFQRVQRLPARGVRTRQQVVVAAVAQPLRRPWLGEQPQRLVGGFQRRLRIADRDVDLRDRDDRGDGAPRGIQRTRVAAVAQPLAFALQQRFDPRLRLRIAARRERHQQRRLQILRQQRVLLRRQCARALDRQLQHERHRQQRRGARAEQRPAIASAEFPAARPPRLRRGGEHAAFEKLFDVHAQRRDRRITIIWIVRGRAGDQPRQIAVEGAADRGIRQRRCRWRAIRPRIAGRGVARASRQRAVAQHLDQQQAGHVDIGGGGQRAAVAQLRRGVDRRERRCAFAAVFGRVAVVQRPADAEVDQRGRAVGAHQHVRGFEIQVQDQALVGVLDRQTDLPEQLQPFALRRPPFGQIAQQRLAFDVFHDEVGRAVAGFAAVDQAGDAAMVQRGQQRAFAGGPAPQGRGGGAVQALERDPLRAAVDVAFGQPHAGHAAVAQFADQSIAADRLQAGVVHGQRRQQRRAQRVVGRVVVGQQGIDGVADRRILLGRPQPRRARLRRHRQRGVEQGFDSGKGVGHRKGLRGAECVRLSAGRPGEAGPVTAGQRPRPDSAAWRPTAGSSARRARSAGRVRPC